MGAETSPVYAFLQPEHVLPADFYVGGFCRLDRNRHVDKRRTNHHLGVLRASDQRSELREKCRGFVSGLVHFPVTGDDWFAHASLQLTHKPNAAAALSVLSEDAAASGALSGSKRRYPVVNGAITFGMS